MAQIRSYKDLDAWRVAMQLVGDCYGIVRIFPVEERFALGVQMRKAACSVALNIAEGHSRPSVSTDRNDFRRFIGIAIGSVAELETQLLIAHQEHLAPESILAPAFQKTRRVGRMLKRLHASLTPPSR